MYDTIKSAATIAVLLLAIGCSDDSVSSGESTGECAEAVPDDEIPLPIAPASQRVDLDEPQFTNPTAVTNPLFPVGVLEHAVLLGVVDGEPWRAETTVLAQTEEIELADELRISPRHYQKLVAKIEGRPVETMAGTDEATGVRLSRPQGV